MKKINISLFLALIGLSIVGCSNSGNQIATRLNSTGVGVTSTTAAGDTQSYLSCTNSDKAIGRVYSSNYQSLNSTDQFTLAVSNFVSSFMNPGLLGSVSGNPASSTGIEIEGVLAFDSNGKSIVEKSKVSMFVIDDKVGKVDSQTGKVFKAIPIYLNTLTKGSWNKTTGEFSVTFEDKFGEVILSGVIQKSYTSGEVKFINKLTTVSGMPKSGLLGSFYIYSCGFIY